MNNTNAIETRDLTKYYGDFLAVDHIHFDVDQAEIFGFLGPNGAGKSTTIRMLTGISTPTEGTASIFGFDVVKQSVEAKSQIGSVPDISNIYTELSAWENLDFTAKLFGIGKTDRDARTTNLLQRFDLYKRRHEKVEDFSRGMRRRVCIAMALVHDAKILFLDEPTSGLDVKSVRSIRQLIRELNDDGLTIFLTTHNIEEASQMCNRIAIINRGKIAAIDSPEKLKQAMKSSQSIEISFQHMDHNNQEDFHMLPTVIDVQKLGDKYRLLTDDPPTLLRALGRYIEQKNLVPITLNTLSPSLEDTFLQLTGRGIAQEIMHKKRR